MPTAILSRTMMERFSTLKQKKPGGWHPALVEGIERLIAVAE
jgi:hypothetical protein